MELRDKVASERRRLRQVRQLLSAAVAQGAQGSATWVPFYIAVGEYFSAAMERLHTQDIRMGDLLRERADLSSESAQQAMRELDDRLTGNQKHLSQFLAGSDALVVEGEAALDRFESAAGAYTDFITSNMGHHAGTVDIARDSFGSADWAFMALISEADAEREIVLYDNVFAAIPADLSAALPDG
ncbi:MAG: hypothetical protein P8M26_05965 [Gammaproteobacteria bacterium]|nr:hypothetical protein [Gammaproteobacteria bacterium]